MFWGQLVVKIGLGFGEGPNRHLAIVGGEMLALHGGWGRCSQL